MKIIRADEANKSLGPVYVWHHLGDGDFAVVLGYNQKDGWLRCQGQSFMVCADAECVQFDSLDEMKAERDKRRKQLADSRFGAKHYGR